jgi:aminoglycoside phosphotransferase (APT) family kinase protein
MKPSSIEAIREWMNRAGLGSGPIEDLDALLGGTQNVMMKFRRGAELFVLRAPPRHSGARGEEILAREAAMLSALADTAIPHPALLAFCNDSAVAGTRFYLMSYVDGFNATVDLPVPHAADPAMRRRMGLAFIEGAAALGRIDPVRVGLADFGRPGGFLERQVGRWKAELAGYRRHAGWPGPESLGRSEVIESWLTRYMPRSARPGIVHGDYHLANVLFCRTSAELASIVDWELATIGDPLLDLGWILATWSDEKHGEAALVPAAPWSGFPERAEIAAHYAAHSDRDLSAIDWYAVLACYKLGILLEGSHARACAGLISQETGLLLHTRAQVLFRRAERIVAAA